MRSRWTHATIARETGGGYDAATVGDELAGAVGRLQAAVDGLAQVDLDEASARGLLDAVAALERQRRRVDAQLTRLVGAADRRDAARLDGCVTTAAWLRTHAGVDDNDATVRVKSAFRLRRLPHLRDAYLSGQISPRRVEMICRAAVPQRIDAIALVEDSLVHLAMVGTRHSLRRALQHVKDITDPAPGDQTDAQDPDGADSRREVHASVTFDGLVKVDALLDQITGEMFLTILDALDTPDPLDTPPADQRTPAQRRHDALREGCRRLLDGGLLPAANGQRPHVLVMVDLEGLGVDANAVRRMRLRWTGDLPPAIARTLLDDARFTPILTWGPWRPVAVGRTHRTLPPYLRPVLEHVHGHCRGPGCDRPIPWTQAHHTIPWAAGGETDLDRTVPLCQAHHTLVTSGGWDVAYDPDTAVCTWTSPDRRTIRTHPPPP